MHKTDYDSGISNREFKSSAFTAYFGEPEHAADLYRALSHNPDVRPEDIEYQTLQGVMFMARKNDMAFTVRQKVLVIGKHQSTVNLNMPLRSAIYYGRTRERIIQSKNMYKTSLIQIPSPEFYMFYNGQASQPAESIFKLSDAYLEKTDIPMLESTVRMIHINPELNRPLLKESNSMYEYSHFMQTIRNYIASGLDRDVAVITAMERCVEEGIMVDFINVHGSEVRNMLFTQFNMEDALAVCGEENYERGLQDSIHQSIHTIIKTCKQFGIPKEDVLQRIISGFSLEQKTAEEYMNRYWL